MTAQVQDQTLLYFLVNGEQETIHGPFGVSPDERALAVQTLLTFCKDSPSLEDKIRGALAVDEYTENFRIKDSGVSIKVILEHNPVVAADLLAMAGDKTMDLYLAWTNYYAKDKPLVLATCYDDQTAKVRLEDKMDEYLQDVPDISFTLYNFAPKGRIGYIVRYADEEGQDKMKWFGWYGKFKVTKDTREETGGLVVEGEGPAIQHNICVFL